MNAQIHKHNIFDTCECACSSQNYFTENKFLLLCYRGDLSRPIIKYICFFMVCILLFSLSPLFSRPYGQIKFEIFSYIKYHPVLNIYKRWTQFLSFDQSFLFVTCSNQKTNKIQLKSWTVFKLSSLNYSPAVSNWFDLAFLYNLLLFFNPIIASL